MAYHIDAENVSLDDLRKRIEATDLVPSRASLTDKIGDNTLEILARLADLMRVQWVSPTFARMLIVAGYGNVAKVAAANADDLCKALSSINAGDRFFKGKIGLRDVKRLVQAASYVF